MFNLKIFTVTCGAYCICKIYSWNLFISLVANATFACNTFPSPFIVLTETLNWIHSRKTSDWKRHKVAFNRWNSWRTNLEHIRSSRLNFDRFNSINLHTNEPLFSINKLNQHKNEIELQIEFRRFRVQIDKFIVMMNFRKWRIPFDRPKNHKL